MLQFYEVFANTYLVSAKIGFFHYCRKWIIGKYIFVISDKLTELTAGLSGPPGRPGRVSNVLIKYFHNISIGYIVTKIRELFIDMLVISVSNISGI